MSDTRMKTRIIHKHAIESDWAKAVNFVPLKGELIVYDVDDNYNYERIKIGDGVQNVNDLPFETNRSLKVTVSRDADENNVVDKTYQEIYDAVSAGAYVYMVTGNTIYVNWCSMWPNTILWLSYCSDYSAIFSHQDGSSEYEVEINSDGEVSLYYSSSLPSQYSYGYEGMVLTVGEDGVVNPADFPDTIARTTDVEEVKELVGDTSVSEQINTAAVNNQSDWFVNDETSPAYVKNRPFYETDPLEVNVVDETTLSRNDFYKAGYNDCTLSADILCNSGLVEGQEYIVTINGVNYVTIAKFLSGTVYLGNFNIINSELENSGETYYIDDYCFSIYNDDNVLDSYVVKIIAIETQCIQIDEKFLNNKPGKFMPKGKTVSVFSKMTQSSHNVVVGENAEVFNSECNIAAGSYSHAEGNETVATGYGAHSEGGYTEATNVYAHAEGNSSIASGASSHAENNSIASGNYSHSEGESTIAASDYQHVQGKHNIEDADDKYAHIVGNGDHSSRSNAHTLDWNGNAWFQGAVKIGGTGQDDETAKELATQEYVNSFLPKCTSITLPATSWTGDTNPWSQVVNINGVTANSKVDLQPTAVQIVSLQGSEITLMLQNDNGVVTAWAIGNKPVQDYTMQVLITEVVRV